VVIRYAYQVTGPASPLKRTFEAESDVEFGQGLEIDDGKVKPAGVDPDDFIGVSTNSAEAGEDVEVVMHYDTVYKAPWDEDNNDPTDPDDLYKGFGFDGDAQKLDMEASGPFALVWINEDEELVYFHKGDITQETE